MKRVLFTIFVTFFLFVNLVEGNPYVNNIRYFYALDEDFNYQDINSMTFHFSHTFILEKPK